MVREKFSRDQLVQRIVRAQIKLESLLLKHRDFCVVKTDPESTAPCNCGASDHNRKVQAALNELKLD